MIGLSGLITPSLDEMVTVAGEMQRLGLKTPLLIGGATTSKAHTALRIDPAYEGPVIHVLDASRAVGVASSLVSDTQCEPLIAKTSDEYEALRIARSRSGQSELATLEEARANGFAFDPSGQAPPPKSDPASTRSANGRCATSRPRSTGRPSSAPGSWPAIIPQILDDKVVGESARSLFNDANAMLDQMIAERWVTAEGDRRPVALQARGR